MVCPSCKKSIANDLPTRPFCSTRCRQVDLGKWLNEEYRVPVHDSNDEVETTDREQEIN
ncbi:MAG: DNA gyrase inhibitor YacG [Polyangiaceae bacterium]|nr:DNA gyrase inhibitor YacG [Polyangiaceae bacterium]